MMSDPTKPDMDLFFALFDSIDDDGQVGRDGKPVRKAEPVPAPTATDFEAEVAAAEVEAVIDNGESEMGHRATLNVGQFGSRAAEIFGIPAMDARDADRVDSDTHVFYKTLQRIRYEQPRLYRILMARKAWMRRDNPVDSGPFGNNWGE